ncbi:MAG: WG repeat-containing protein [Clostridia bacterium]|nr:WG repeat-containing protein [Clostridia bacterium]
MRGKIVNLCIGFLNILFGVLLLVYTLNVPQDQTLLTVQENFVAKIILFAIYAVLAVVFAIDVIQYYNHVKDNTFKTGYMIALFAISFIFIKQPAIASFTIISGIIIVFNSLRENLVEIDSTTAISVTVLVMAVIVILMGVSLSYKQIGNYIKDKENENELEYKSTFFKYITELGIDDVYINLKRDGKYGYINQDGNVVIDFKYDYASPFVKIVQYNKIFDIALVCEDGRSKIILKNEREVMTYRTESSDENYSAKWQELENIYKQTLGQGTDMETEVPYITNSITRVPAYKEDFEEEYTYRYDYNEEYDVLVTQSTLGLGDKYELAKKDNLEIKLELDAKNLSYDEHYLYLFSNGTIPFYDIANREQGWFTHYGKKNSMMGKAQILEFFGERMLIKNYNDKTTYFIDENGEMLSEAYRNIYICKNKERYIVKTLENKYKIIDTDYNKVIENEYDILDAYLANYGLYIVTNVDEEIEFNDYGFAKMNFSIINSNGDVIIDNVEQVYKNFYQISNDKSVAYATRYSQFLDNLKSIEYNFVGDSFYKNY